MEAGLRESPFPGETRRAEGGVQRQASHETIQRRVGKIEVVTCMYFAVHIGGPVLQSVSNLYRCRFYMFTDGRWQNACEIVGQGQPKNYLWAFGCCQLGVWGVYGVGGAGWGEESKRLNCPNTPKGVLSRL